MLTRPNLRRSPPGPEAASGEKEPEPSSEMMLWVSAAAAAATATLVSSRGLGVVPASRCDCGARRTSDSELPSDLRASSGGWMESELRLRFEGGTLR